MQWLCKEMFGWEDRPHAKPDSVSNSHSMIERPKAALSELHVECRD